LGDTYSCDGFGRSLYTPSPNDQFQNVGVFAELSVNVTVNGANPEVGRPEKSATGVVSAETGITNVTTSSTITMVKTVRLL
jgi:hypothetical protein